MILCHVINDILRYAHYVLDNHQYAPYKERIVNFLPCLIKRTANIIHHQHPAARGTAAGRSGPLRLLVVVKR